MNVRGSERRDVEVEVDPLIFVLSMEREFYNLMGVPERGNGVHLKDGQLFYTLLYSQSGNVREMAGPKLEKEDLEALEALLQFKQWVMTRIPEGRSKEQLAEM